VHAPKISNGKKVPVHRALARLGGIALSCMLALSSGRCVNDMITIDDTYNYGNGGGYGSHTGTVPLGHDPDSLANYDRQLGGSTTPSGRELVPGSALAY
jgi:hypothetical protein